MNEPLSSVAPRPGRDDGPDDAAPAEAAGPASLIDALARVRDLDELEHIRRAVQAIGAAAYRWTIASDRLQWAGDVGGVFSGVDGTLIATGRGYASLLDRDNVTSRFEAVMRAAAVDAGEGVPFAIEYQLRPHGPEHARSYWIEDTGRWFGGPDGRPAEVYGMVRRIDERYRRDQHLQFLGQCDPLTGMMNRGRLAEALGEVIATAKREGQTCALLVISVSNLPVVNDAYGFEVADEVILALGRRLRQVVRAGDAIGRYSGGKFGLILANCSEAELQSAAERFLCVARDSVIDTERGPVWALLSIGGVLLPTHADSANAAMACAEEALAEAARQPTDSFVAYRPSPERLSMRSLNARCGAEIVTGLRENRFSLAYQPVIAAGSGEVAFHEALLRMTCQNGDTVTALHLVPVAEKLGLIRLVDRTVVGMAVDELVRFPEARISLNVSGITIADPRWLRQLTELLSLHRDVTDRLIVEITETVALNDIDHAVDFINSLRVLGCRVAIDDFGAGYTSFRNLKVLDVDMVKIDGSFCDRLSHNRENQYFVRTLIDLARKFKLETVAEWVNDEADAELLRQWGVDYLQGNLFGEAARRLPWSEPVAGNLPQAEVFDARLAVGAAASPRDWEEADGSEPVAAFPGASDAVAGPLAPGEMPSTAPDLVPWQANDEAPFGDRSDPAPPVPHGWSVAAQAEAETAGSAPAGTIPPLPDVPRLDFSRLRAAVASLDAAFACPRSAAEP